MIGSTHRATIAPPATRRVAVLVALDGSPAAATALPLARAVAAQLGAALEVLHVAAAPLSPAARRHWQAYARDAGAGLQLGHGVPAAAILAAAAEPGVALVVLATHGRAVAPGRALGRVARAVVAGAGRPILLVRPEAAAGGAAAPLRRLLLPLDGTTATAGALGPVGELAARLGAGVDLLYVAGAGRAAPGERGGLGAPLYVDQPQHEWPHWAYEFHGRLRACCAEWPAGVPVRVYLGRGEIGDAIGRVAAAGGHDAIALVRRSRLEPGRARVLRAVLDRTPCAVVLVGGPADCDADHAPRRPAVCENLIVANTSSGGLVCNASRARGGISLQTGYSHPTAAVTQSVPEPATIISLVR